MLICCLFSWLFKGCIYFIYSLSTVYFYVFFLSYRWLIFCKKKKLKLGFFWLTTLTIQSNFGQIYIGQIYTDSSYFQVFWFKCCACFHVWLPLFLFFFLKFDESLIRPSAAALAVCLKCVPKKGPVLTRHLWHTDWISWSEVLRITGGL